MSENPPAAEPSDALRKQLKSDAGPHPTPDQERAAAKRRDAAGVKSDKGETRTAPPVDRKSVVSKNQTA